MALTRNEQTTGVVVAWAGYRSSITCQRLNPTTTPQQNMIYYNHKGEDCSQGYYEQFRDEWLVECQKLVDEHMRNYSWDEHLEISKGRRYDKIMCVHHDPERGSKRVWAFIDKTNGDILKPATWRKPAKHARGNIYEEDRMLFVNHSGPAYMDKIKEYYGA